MDANGNEMTAAGKILSEMLWAEYNAQFAIKVSDIIAKRNPEETSPWEWDPSESISYHHFQEDFKAGISTYCALRRVLKTIATDDVVDALEKEIKESAEKLADEKLVTCGWIKKGEANG